MKRIFLALLIVGSVQAADVVTVDPAGTVVIAGTVPTAPIAGEVRLGGGQVNAQGTVTAGDVVVNRATQAAGAQAVRGDDPRMSNLGLPQGYLAFSTPGSYTFTIPANTTQVYACVVGGGGGAGGSKGPSTYTSVWIPGGAGGAGGRLMSRLVVVPGQNTLQILVGGLGSGGMGGGLSGNEAKNTQGGGGGGGGSQLTYNGFTYIAGGGAGGGGAKPGSYTGYSNRGGNGGNAMTNGETVPSYGWTGGLGAVVGVTTNGGIGGTGGTATIFPGQAGGGGNSGGFLDHHFWFLFSTYEIGNSGAGGSPNLSNPNAGALGGNGYPGAIILRW